VKKFAILFMLSICLISTTASMADIERDLVQNRFNRYLEHLKAGEYDAAVAYWMSDHISSTYKFGIFYKDVPFKYDCNSPYIQNLDGINNGSVKTEVTIIPKGNMHYRAVLKLTDSLGEVRHNYFISRGEDMNFYIVTRYWDIIQTMKTHEQKYVRLYYFKEPQINDYALELLDTKIEEIAGMLGIDEKSLNRLAEDKMTYILTENINQIQEFAGFPSAGWHDPSNNFIITSHLPHCKLITEFLVAYKLGELPLHTIPFMKNGLAVYLGGRAGTRLNVFGQLVEFSLKEKFFNLEDLLTSTDFGEKLGGVDFSYTLAGYFVAYLDELIGMEKLISLYLDLSGSQKQIDKLSMKQIKEILEQTSGKSWTDIENGFMTFFDTGKGTEVQASNAKAEGEIVYQSGSPNYSVTIYESDDNYILHAYAFDGSSPVSASLIFNYSPIGYNAEYQSSLFSTQFPDSEYDKQFYGIMFNQEEIGIYNYLTNEITSKYISSLAGDQGAQNAGSVTYKFAKQQMPSNFSNYKIQLIETPY